MLILEQESAGENGVPLEYLVHYSQGFSSNCFWEGGSCGIPAGLPSEQEGQELPTALTRKFQLLEGNSWELKSQFLTGKENKSTLHFCSSVGKKIHSKLSQPLIWLPFTPLLIYAAVFLLCINLRWTLTIQQKIYYLESIKWNSVQEVKQVKIWG